MLSYYGSKWSSARKYPAPKHDTIIEPFAGGAGYSQNYPDRYVLLTDLYEPLIGAWQFLIDASSEEILSLPLMSADDLVDDLDISQKAKWLIGFSLAKANASPRKSLSAWAREYPDNIGFWGERCRERLAKNTIKTDHWSATVDDYRNIPNIEATWFIDPPYKDMGKHYPKGSDQIDYEDLADWCRSRRGQVIVCENAGADWMDFIPLYDLKGASNRTRKEMIWYKDGN